MAAAGAPRPVPRPADSAVADSRMPESAPSEGTSVFLSYTSEDLPAAEAIAAGLRAAGYSVWFDKHELRGGDAWDHEIRQRIRTCTFFVPLVSAATEGRPEGYFRREWKLAVERSRDMAEDHPFILPVVLGGGPAEPRRVPERFLEVQLHRLGPGADPASVAAQLRRLEGKRDSGGAERSGRTSRPWAPAHRRRHLPRWALAGAGLVFVVALALFLWRDRFTGAAPGSEISVAVLPFENFGGDPANDYFSDGLTEELLTALGREPGLRIVARTSCFAFKGKKLPVQEIGALLNATKLVEGSVRRFGDRIRVSIRLVNAADGFQLWSEVFEPTATNLFEAQASLARTVAAKLQPGRTPRPDATLPNTRNFDAYDAFLRGRSFQLKAPTRENIAEAIGHFRRATELDPTYAVAWAHYAEAKIRLHHAGYDENEANLREARVAIGQAFSFAPDLPQAHRALAGYYTVNWTNIALAEKELLLAEKGLPNDPDILADLAVNNLDRGNKDKAVAYIRRAVAVDLQNADIADLAAVIFDFASLYADAARERERAFRIAGWPASIVDLAYVQRNWRGDLALALQTLDLARPDDRTPADNVGLYWRVRAALLLAKGDHAEALAAVARMPAEFYPTQFFYNSRSFLEARIREAMGDADGARAAYTRALADAERYRQDSPGKIRAHTMLALIYAGLGRHDDAWNTARKCLELAPPTESVYLAARVSLRIVAQVAARTGRMEEALAIVREQVERGFWKRHDLLLDPDWHHLRQDARFMALARQARL